MNKLITALLLVALSSSVISCKEEEETITESDLPQEAVNFIQLHFPGETIKRIIRDNEKSVDYDVWLDNGFALEFDEAGIWNQIDGKELSIPTSIIDELPEPLTTYLSENYESYAVVSLDIEGGVYEVVLSTQVEMHFDTNGNFIRLDD
jgi:hypothetical protein